MAGGDGASVLTANLSFMQEDSLLSPSSPFNVGFSGTKRRERECVCVCVYKIEGEDGGRRTKGVQGRKQEHSTGASWYILRL